jgi:Tol biopolymer transport system component
MPKVLSLVFLLTLAALVASIDDANASPGITTIVSVDSAGAQGNFNSSEPALSSDGRFIAFSSFATNLVANDTNRWRDVFVHDRDTGITERVNVNQDGVQALGGDSWMPAISADGRFVAFYSVASNLVPGNDDSGIYVHDRETGNTELVSVDSAGIKANGPVLNPAISGNGRFVAFASSASNLVPRDSNGTYDIFVHDRVTGVTERVNVNQDGVQALEGSSWMPAISADGSIVAFDSSASNLVPDDTNNTADIFVHDRQTGITERVSVDSAGGEGNGLSFRAAISADGRFVAFDSLASNLVAGDTNTFCPGTPFIVNITERSTSNCPDIFVHDRLTRTTERVSVDSAGVQTNSASIYPAISADGRFVTFISAASNLVAGDTNGLADIFVHDRWTGATERVSVDNAGVQANRHSSGPAISGVGRFVAFHSLSTNLVADDTNGALDAFVHDRSNPPDSDGDGVPDGVDSCPLTSSMGFDADADGCTDTLGGLIAMVESLTPEPKIEGGLLAKLNGAQTALASDNMRVAGNNLRSFINQVKAQRGKSLTSPQADLLVAYANNLILLM